VRSLRSVPRMSMLRSVSKVSSVRSAFGPSFAFGPEISYGPFERPGGDKPGHFGRHLRGLYSARNWARPRKGASTFHRTPVCCGRARYQSVPGGMLGSEPGGTTRVRDAAA